MAFDWCVMLAPTVRDTARGAVLADAKWARGTAIKFGFIDGADELRDRVAAVAAQWLTRTDVDLTFERRNCADQADIRISFTRRGSWSYLGRYARGIAKDQPTMNFGWLTPESSDAEIQEVVLHEFGHAMGFVHEHQNPDGGMLWDRQRVIQELSGPPNSWSLEQIETNVLGQYDPRALRSTPFDPDSIMLYPFPASWTEDGRATTNNGDLSPVDIQLARDIYA